MHTDLSASASLAHSEPTAQTHEWAGGFDDYPSERGFVAMRTAYRATGGLASGDDLDRLLQDCRFDDPVSLAGRLDAGEVFGFDWQHRVWIPMFQFDLRDLSVKPGPQQVRLELSGEFHGWTLAAWFTQRNVWLNQRRPIDLLDTALPAVLEAARADRFVATG
jgi:hypothetical protein